MLNSLYLQIFIVYLSFWQWGTWLYTVHRNNIRTLHFTLKGDKVSILTHTYLHKTLRKWQSSITKLTTHIMCGLMSDLICKHRKRLWPYMTPNSLPRPGVVKHFYFIFVVPLCWVSRDEITLSDCLGVHVLYATWFKSITIICNSTIEYLLYKSWLSLEIIL